ncbi:MAG: ribonuclease P protein component [Pseudomonadales bacterium]|nr:ribonuclease P protein component [Pseudomonadales bacterium]
MVARCWHGAVHGDARSFPPEIERHAVTTPGPTSLGPERRLPDKAAFDRVFSAPDIRQRRHPFSLLARKRDAGPARLGMVVGKRHARRAVDRNRLRRILREHFRRTSLAGLDVVVLARQGAGDVDRAALHDAANWLFQRLAEKASEQSTC